MATRITATKASNGHQILVFLFGTFLLSSILQIYIIREIKTFNTFAMVFLTWIPGAVGFACSKYFGHRFRDLAMIRPGNRSLAMAYAIPALSSILMLIVLVVSDVGKFKLPDQGWFRYIVFQPTIGVLVTAVLAYGQEIGWRGFLHNRLMRAQIPEPLIVTGFIWSLWNWPMILFLGYSSSPMPYLSVTLFTLMSISFSIILGWLREFSKSIFPPTLAHAVHLTWLQYIIPGFYLPGKMDPYFGGQSGFVLTIIYIVIAAYIYKRHPVGRY